MINKVHTLFTSHPQSVNETYTEHFKIASYYGWTMLISGIACLIHAVLPFLFLTTASSNLKTLNKQMKDRIPDYGPKVEKEDQIKAA
ncbi:MAG TPA: DUF6356 family protein [Gammaproteobacteria bacterium]|jgi:hypothetical protein|nr:DUF6356 family protein [Gammaproteobacteria bacterium]|tara:strand:+ start:145 stop:405 length:261 start_codon:yes stop_codon:yes gene_type:complete